jgi:hypothetical protein
MTKDRESIHEGKHDSAGRSESEPIDERSKSYVGTEEDGQGSSEKQQKWHTVSSKRLGCLLFIIFGGIGGFLFTAYFPGYLAHRDRMKRRQCMPFIEAIQSSLQIYSETHSEKLFPLEVRNYEAIRQIVSNAGKSIPNSQTDAMIDYFRYETTKGKSYILHIIIEGDDQHFFTLYPHGIIEVSAIDQIDTESAMGLVRALLYMDRAIKDRDAAKYLAYYSPEAPISIKRKTYKGEPYSGDEVSSAVYDDLSSYSKGLTDFYSNAFPEHREREEIFISRQEQHWGVVSSHTDWEISSGYTEEGTIQGQKYLENGQSIYGMALSKSPQCIVSDESFSFIYLIED